jgi:C-terminal processing protease CtpA/Prc
VPKSFFDWYSQKTAQSVSAVIGGNLLKTFRFVIDYPDSAIYLEQQKRLPEHEFDLVGLVLAPSRDHDGYYSVRSVATKNGKEEADGIEPGDKLLQIDGRDLQGESLATVIDALQARQ